MIAAVALNTAVDSFLASAVADFQFASRLLVECPTYRISIAVPLRESFELAWAHRFGLRRRFWPF